MFDLAGNRDIGEYLFDCMRNKNYISVRQFAKDCLERKGKIINEETIRRESNRFYQIMKGEKRIQQEDLPYVCDMLDITCENLLSAGRNEIPREKRMANYNVASSADPAEWEKYMNIEGRPCLKADEYGKTILDYAVEFGNFDFVNYLFENDYLTTEKKTKALGTFSIECSLPVIGEKIGSDSSMCHLSTELEHSYKLQCGLAALAVRSENYELAKKLISREIPRDAKETAALHREIIRNGDLKFPEWLTEEHEITTKIINNSDFIYANLGDLIKCAVDKCADDKIIDFLIEKAVNHNSKVIENLKKHMYECSDDAYVFRKDLHLVEFDSVKSSENKPMRYFYIANAVCVNSESAKVSEINRLYKNIFNSACNIL